MVEENQNLCNLRASSKTTIHIPRCQAAVFVDLKGIVSVWGSWELVAFLQLPIYNGFKNSCSTDTLKIYLITQFPTHIPDLNPAQKMVYPNFLFLHTKFS